MSATHIRLYGDTGRGSWAQVTEGMLQSLRHHGLLAGFVSASSHQEDSEEPGADAPIAIICGSPGNIELSHAAGIHQKRWFMLAPNSEGVAPRFAEELLKPTRTDPNVQTIDGLLATSAWAKTVLERVFGGRLPVVNCPHGVNPVFRPAPHAHDYALRDYAEGKFRVLHVTSAKERRKGTRDLIRAWAMLCDRSEAWRNGCGLAILTHSLALEEYRHAVFRAGLEESQCRVWAGFSMGVEEIRNLYLVAHLVVQPSRVEGFGLVPCEALSCGVPVVATTCTGHGQWIWHDDSPRAGVVVCPHQNVHEPSDDYPGATSPGVRAEDIAASLEEARERWLVLSQEALAAAPALEQEWAWERVTNPALKRVATNMPSVYSPTKGDTDERRDADPG